MLNSLRLIRWPTLQWRQGCSLTRKGADRGRTHDCFNTHGFTVCICAHTCVCCSMLPQPYSPRQNQPTAHTYLGTAKECLTTELTITAHTKYFKTRVGYYYKVTLHGIAWNTHSSNHMTFPLKTILASVKLHHPRIWQKRNRVQINTIRYCACACVVQVDSYPSTGSQIVLVAQFKRFFLLFLPIVPSEQTKALSAAQKPANSVQRHSNKVKCAAFFYPGRWL